MNTFLAVFEVLIIAAIITLVILAAFQIRNWSVPETEIIDRRPREQEASAIPKKKAASQKTSGLKIGLVILITLVVAMVILVLKPADLINTVSIEDTKAFGRGHITLLVDNDRHHIHAGDSFIVELSLTTSFPEPICPFAKSTSISLIDPAADISEVHPFAMLSRTCSGFGRWIVAPRRSGHQDISIDISKAPHAPGTLIISPPAASVDVDDDIKPDILLTALVSIVVAFIALWPRE